MLRSVLGLVLASALWSSPASALDPGTYTVHCGPSVLGGRETNIRMDLVDLLTLRRSLGTIISGVNPADGKKIILIANDGNCSLVEADAQPLSR